MIEGDIHIALLAVDLKQVASGAVSIAVQRRDIAVIAQGDLALPQGCEGLVFAVGRGVGVLQVAAVVGGIDSPLLHADTGGEACRLILTVVGVVQIAESQAAGSQCQITEVVAVSIDSGNERAGDVSVARDFDLGLAAGGERGELGLGCEGCGDAEGFREVDASGTELESDAIPVEPPLPEPGRSIYGSVTYADTEL
ncbi:hypothetical protein IFO68_12155 [Photobacterium sp. CAU 1568]|uniref:Uncharacterized protein n=1 Tax=Photobacterium arenosum TaxID=2774143 RepID=A0ABR9BLJ6_9GAMM|nr:hypothetical protein [Photobacterium arenosum]MBD8513423.1 hypothetical protein [Photobacterium arenosum]